MTSIYVHIPFCLRKCLYCSFTSYSGLDYLKSDYVESVIRESKQYKPCEVSTVYFGGGTPTCLETNLLIKLLKALTDRFPCNGEITIEANPATVSFEELRELRNAGFNRISIGIQSFNDIELKLLGRLHTANDAEQAVKSAYEAGFHNISGDLMFGIPEQTMESLEHTLEKMCSLPLTHISAYSLSVDEGTPFYNMNLSLPDEETERQMYYRITEKLSQNGFEHYEISNYAKKGRRAAHNTGYWLGKTYIGLGAGAHSYYYGKRYSNTCDVIEYIGGDYEKEGVTVIDEKEKRKEHYMLGLRLIEGTQDIGHKNVPKLIEEGLLERNGNLVKLTKKGLDLANYVFEELL